jgi:hypothetical protein
MIAWDAGSDGSGLIIDFQPGISTYLLDGVIDSEGDGTALGVELLGLMAESGPLKTPDENTLNRAGFASIAIDEDADAIYLRIRRGKATRQTLRKTIVVVHRLAHIHVSSTR